MYAQSSYEVFMVGTDGATAVFNGLYYYVSPKDITFDLYGVDFVGHPHLKRIPCRVFPQVA